MKYLLSLLICVPLLGQVTLSQEEMLGIANNIKELQHSDSMKTVQIGIYDELVKELESRIETDSLILVKKDEQISLLKERDKANEKMVKLVKSKWYENQYLWLGIGFVLGKI
tara:strand:- start:208 stop:543 length:336 start_codon:yes stop_codon:yes gene_type:complete